MLRLPRLRLMALGFVSAWFLLGGIGHFVMHDFFLSIVPPWVPWPAAAVYISGVFEIAGALALWHLPLRRLAGNALILLTLAVTPANVHMWLNPEKYLDVPEPLLSLRLVFQVFFLWLIWWSTRMPQAAPLAEQASSGSESAPS